VLGTFPGAGGPGSIVVVAVADAVVLALLPVDVPVGALLVPARSMVKNAIAANDARLRFMGRL
jgi:hypothetical protein